MSAANATLDEIRAALDSEDARGALALIERAVESGDVSADLLLLRARTYERLRDREGAAIDYAKLAELLGGHPDALVPVAIQLAHLERHDDELAIYDKILAADPRHFDGLYLKALRLVKSGRHDECLGFIDRAIAVRPDDGNAHYTKACAHALLGQRDLALASVRRAIAVAPSLRFHIAMDDDFASIAGDPEFLEATRARD